MNPCHDIYIEYLFDLYYIITFEKMQGYLPYNVLPMNRLGRYGRVIH